MRGVDVARRLLVGRRPSPAAPAQWAPASRARSGGVIGRRRRHRRDIVLRGALFVGALLRFALLALAFLAALLGFHHVLAQFAIVAEQTAIGNNKFRFLFFFWHKFLIRLELER